MRPPHPLSTRRETNRAHLRARPLEHRFRPARFMPVVFDGIGAPLTAGVKGDVAVHFDAVVTRWRLLADQAGDIQIDIWKTPYASFPATVADSITGAEQPILTGSDHAESTALTGWTTTISDGDTLRFNIDSASTVTRVTLLLTLAG